MLALSDIHPICGQLEYTLGGDSPGDPDLHDTGHQQDIVEQYQWWPSVESVAETRGLEPNQWFFAMNSCI